MQLPIFKTMYEDAMIIEELTEVVKSSMCVEISSFTNKWTVTSSKIGDFIARVASKDVGIANSMVEAWKYSLEEKDDFRVVSGRILSELIPAIGCGMSILYEPFKVENNNLLIEKTPSNFMTIFDKRSGKYLHSPIDPMDEASTLAEKIYDTSMDSFHILGSGLGYLPYQVWVKSEKLAHIFVYEDDLEMIEYADQIGVLSWIDSEYLTIVSSDAYEEVLSRFVESYKKCNDNAYVSDWKVGLYTNSKYSHIIENIDFNGRTNRVCKNIWNINIRENKKLQVEEIEKIKLQNELLGKECVVISAGPSLDDNIEFLKESTNDKVLIAINASLKRLAKEKIKPDLIVVIDPLPSLSDHIEGIEGAFDNIPLVMPINASCTFAKKINAKKYIISDYNKTKDGFIWNFGGTVASLGIDVAYYLKATKIYLVGSDLAYSGGKNYAGCVAHQENEGMNNEIEVESTDGGMVKTNNLYNSYRQMIEKQIACHQDVPIYNLAQHGAKINGTIC